MENGPLYGSPEDEVRDRSMGQVDESELNLNQVLKVNSSERANFELSEIFK